MHETSVSYTDCLAGKYSRRRSGHPFESYFAQRGARIRSNVFYDPTLNLQGEPIHNLLQIIQSGRKQGFEKLRISMPRGLFRFYLKVAGQLMVLQKVVILANEQESELEYFVYYPDQIWLEAAYWEARSRTPLHPEYLSLEELEHLQLLLSFTHTSAQDENLLLRALDLRETFPSNEHESDWKQDKDPQ